MKKKKVLVLNGQYTPGYKGGGPIQSCVNMIENLYEYYEFYVLCADRDYKEEKPYPDIKINGWNEVGHAQVYYMSPDKMNLQGLMDFFSITEYDIVYLNGFFSPYLTIQPLILRLFGKIKEGKFILCPRGDFTGGCENKKIKKYSYIYFVKMIGLYNELLWHATSELEKRDILMKFPKAEIMIAPNLSKPYVEKERILKKEKGELRIVFVSRVFPKKNLKYALEIMQNINVGNIVFDIYGPIEDREYWKECEKVIEKLPKNVIVNYRGEVENQLIPQVFEKYHVFLFPTLGENYGHVIIEAIMNNCICILSKGVTPWDEYLELLDCGAELHDKKKFETLIEKCLVMEELEFDAKVKQGKKCLKESVRNDLIVQAYRDIFDK